MLRININLFPGKGGYHFVEKDGATIRADSWAGVMQRVKEYRARNGYAAGDPEREVTAQVCKRNPSHCHVEDERYAEQLTITNMKGRILRWFSRIRGNRPAFVAEQHARNRQQVCATCVKNQPVAGGCKSCGAAITELRQEILGGRARDARLNGCSAAGEDLQTAVHLDQGIDTNPALVPHCWKRYAP